MTVSPVLGRGEGGQSRSRDKGARGVSMEGEGVILGLSLDKEEATRRELELGAELGGSDLKDRCFPGVVADTGVTQKIRGDQEGGNDVFGERHVGRAKRRGCVGKG
jgi:hypothetical protein